MARPVGVITGLAAEAGCLGRSDGGEGVRVRCTGARAEAAAAAATALIAEGCRGLVSFGTAGGLEPRLAAGTLVLADAVIMPDGARIAVDPDWQQRLCARLKGRVPLVTGAIAAADAPLLTPAAKAACRRATGAVAVDMESGAVAGVAARTAIPFLVVRAITDPAERTVPAWVLAGVTSDGRTPVAPIFAYLARSPADLPGLVRLALDARAAMRSLRRVSLAAGPLLAFDR